MVGIRTQIQITLPLAGDVSKESEKMDLTGYPISEKSGRFKCTPDKPMPKGAPGQWEHEGAEDAGGCSEGCCDDYVCVDCGTKWRSSCGH